MLEAIFLLWKDRRTEMFNFHKVGSNWKFFKIFYNSLYPVTPALEMVFSEKQDKWVKSERLETKVKCWISSQ